MGCTASRPNTIVTQNAGKPSSSSSSSSSSCSTHSSVRVTRTFSLPTPTVHHPPICKGDSQHLVSLTSTTYGSLRLINSTNPNLVGHDYLDFSLSPSPKVNNFTSEISDAKDSSLSPDSVINTWELMNGLDDSDSGMEASANAGKLIHDLPIDSPKKRSSFQYLNCNGSEKKLNETFESVRILDLPKKTSSRPLWKHLSEESLLANMDPNVASSYRQALSSRELGNKHSKAVRTMDYSPSCSPLSNFQFHLSGTEDKIVFYCTSLRGIRKTYEDCCSVRMILRGFQVAVDERDVSMDSAYRKELQGALGGKAVSLPQVFIRGRYVGGADEIRRLNEGGLLGNLLEGFPIRGPKCVCERCGDARFMPCLKCNGSRKLFEEEEGLLKRCPECNENGLIRCPGCCS